MNVLIVNKFLIGDYNSDGATMKSTLYGMQYNGEPVNFLQYCIGTNINYKHVTLVETLFMHPEDTIDGKLKKVFKSLKKTGKKANNRPTDDINKTNNARINETATNKTSSKSYIPNNNKSVKKEILSGLYNTLPASISKSNWEQIKRFQPDLIYTQGGGILVLKQAIKLSKKLDCPIVFHCMDDYKETVYTGSFITRIFNIITKSGIKKANKCSIENLGICEKMAQYYSETYKKPYSYAANCMYKFAEKSYEANNNKTLNIYFSGALHINRGNVLLEVAEVVDELNNEGYPYTLSVFGPESQIDAYKKDFSPYNNSSLFPYVPRDQVLENLEKSDLLVHVEPFDEKDVKYVKYSFSTKLSEYLASGRCVIGYGPKDVASISYIADKNCGPTASNKQQLKEVLKDLYVNRDKLTRFSENSLKVAKNEHQQNFVQNKVLEVFKHTLYKTNK